MLIKNRPRPGIGQRHAIQQRLRFATCEEVDCELLLHGKTFVQQVKPAVGRAATTQRYDPATGMAVIHHPAGFACGAACPNEYCPCVNAGGIPGAGGYPHRLPDERFGVAFGLDGRRVSADQAVETLEEGVEAIRFLRTRGL